MFPSSFLAFKILILSCLPCQVFFPLACSLHISSPSFPARLVLTVCLTIRATVHILGHSVSSWTANWIIAVAFINRFLSFLSSFPLSTSVIPATLLSLYPLSGMLMLAPVFTPPPFRRRTSMFMSSVRTWSVAMLPPFQPLAGIIWRGSVTVKVIRVQLFKASMAPPE